MRSPHWAGCVLCSLLFVCWRVECYACLCQIYVRHLLDCEGVHYAYWWWFIVLRPGGTRELHIKNTSRSRADQNHQFLNHRIKLNLAVVQTDITNLSPTTPTS